MYVTDNLTIRLYNTNGKVTTDEYNNIVEKITNTTTATNMYRTRVLTTVSDSA
jgi:hypothetical protein